MVAPTKKSIKQTCVRKPYNKKARSAGGKSDGNHARPDLGNVWDQLLENLDACSFHDSSGSSTVLERDDVVKDLEEVEELASKNGLVLERMWTDAQGMYNFCMFRKPVSPGPCKVKKHQHDARCGQKP